MDCVSGRLTDAKLTPAGIDKIVLVGGSTRTPLVSAMLERTAGPAGPSGSKPRPVRGDGSGGAGGDHRRRRRGGGAGGHHAAFARHQVPRRLRWAFRSSFVLRRSSAAIRALPASRSEVFHTYRDRQKEVEIDVYQGESDDVRRNPRVGKFMIQGLAPVEAGNPIVVQLDLNLDGMLKVSARERATGLQKQVVIENALAQFEADERARSPRPPRPSVGRSERSRSRMKTRRG